MNDEYISIDEQIIKRIKDHSDYGKRCDYLLEHDEATHLIDYIERLNKELDYISSELNKCQEKILEKDNIINEFDKWLLGEQMMFYISNDKERLIRYGETVNKWLELKGEDNE